MSLGFLPRWDLCGLEKSRVVRSSRRNGERSRLLFQENFPGGHRFPQSSAAARQALPAY